MSTVTLTMTINEENVGDVLDRILRKHVAPVAPADDRRFWPVHLTDTPAVDLPPAIGEVWPGQGGIYAGIARGRDGQPDQHLVLAEAVPTERLDWLDAGEWAKKVAADGHTDFTLPTRWESALLYANLQDKLDTSYWHWTSTQYSEGSAWCQGFNGGGQSSGGVKSFKALARAVRRFSA